MGYELETKKPLTKEELELLREKYYRETTPDEKAEPIVFSEWSPVNGSLIKRRDFQYDKLLENVEYTNGEVNLFSDTNEPVFIPTPIKDYPLIHFLNLADAATN